MRHRHGKNETIDRFPPRSPGKSNEWNARPKCDQRIRQRRPRKGNNPLLERFASCIAFDGKGKVPRRMPKRKIRPKRRRPRRERKCKRRYAKIEGVADPPAAESVKRPHRCDTIRESMNPRPRVRKWDCAPKRPCETTDSARIARRGEGRIAAAEVHPTKRKERSFRKPRPAARGEKNGDCRNAVNRPNRPLRKRSRRPSRKQRIIGCTMGNTNRSGNQSNHSVCRSRPLPGGKHRNPERNARPDAHESKQSHGQGADSSGGSISRCASRTRSSSGSTRKSFGRAAARFARMSRSEQRENCAALAPQRSSRSHVENAPKASNALRPIMKKEVRPPTPLSRKPIEPKATISQGREKPNVPSGTPARQPLKPPTPIKKEMTNKRSMG